MFHTTIRRSTTGLAALAVSLLLASGCGDEGIAFAPDQGPGALDAAAGADAELAGTDGAPSPDDAAVPTDGQAPGEDAGPQDGAPGGPDATPAFDGGPGYDGGPPGADASTSTDGGASDAAAGTSDAGGFDATTPGADAGVGGRDAAAPDASPNPLDPTSDFDCDGLSDADELALGTDPGRQDTDLDGIIDGVEVGRTTAVPGSGCTFTGDADPSTTTSPVLTDSDGDGLPDSIEDRNGNGAREQHETDAASNDTDGDLILDGLEDRDHNGFPGVGESSPIYPDSDFDGLPDGIEDADHDGLRGPGETSATLVDSDQDGLSDGCEDRDHDGTVGPGEPDPRTADSDLDGLEDSDEDTNASCTRDPNETDPSSSDSDCDGLSDLIEQVTVHPGNQRTSALSADSDGDLLTDGVELGVTAAVPLSVCGVILFDTDPVTRTIPTLLDTDGDQRSDGCEDRDHNGAVGAGELNPRALDTDGDGLYDGVEDTDGDCVADLAESDGTLSDTDGDGIGDGVEVALGTNPRLADSDLDGIPDGVEDSNQNGFVDPGETDPTSGDTDGDTISDGVEDADHDGTVDPGETNPRDQDSDGDGLLDGQELTAGTNPTDSDSDNDGLSDGDELTIGTSPTDSDSDNDNVLDGDEAAAGTNPLDPNDPGAQGGSGVNAICAPANLRVVSFYDDAPGDWRVALETSYVYRPATVTRGDHAATFDDTSMGIAGFVADLPRSGAGASIAQMQALILRLTNGAATLGATTVAVQNNGRAVQSHDSFDTAVEARINLTLSAATAPTTIRNLVLAVVGAHALGDFTGLPGAAGAASNAYVLSMSVIVRGGAANRVVVTGALVSQASYANTATLHRQQVEDLSNGTATALAYAGEGTGCDPFPVTRQPRADFIWMADVSGSTDNDRGTIATAAGAIFTGLQNNGVDFRMGVVPHFQNRLNVGAATSGTLRSGFTTSQATFIADLNNVSNTNGCEFGLTAADDAIVRALPRSAPGIVDTSKLRDGAKLVVFYISDEHAQEVESNQCGALDRGTGLTDFFAGSHEQADPTAPQQAAIDAIAAPFVSRILGEDGVAFAQIHPLQTPRCFVDSPTDEEEGYGYFETVAATGGTFYRVCDSNPGAVLNDIIDAVAGAASEFVLAETPISATLKVGLTRAGSTVTTEVPRSATDGFDYDASANTVFFRGATYRPAIGDQVTISYRVFEPPVPPVTCAPPLVLNPITNVCECPTDCGTGGCGPGEVCDRSPAVCACVCTADCGGACGGATECDPATCSCTCAPDCGGTCALGQVCNTSTCSCSCPASCGGRCNARQACDPASCACVCPVDCGGCASGERCDPVQCACVEAPQ